MDASKPTWAQLRYWDIRLNHQGLGLAVTSARSSGNIAISLDQAESGLIALMDQKYPFVPVMKPVGKANIFAVAFSPDGKYLATGGKDCFVRVIDAESFKEIRNHKAHWNFFVDAVAFSPDSRMLYYGVGNNEARAWDLATWQEIRKYSASTGVVNSLAVSPDGKLLAMAGGKGIIRLLDTRTCSEVGELAGHTYPIVGMRVGVRRVVFSADGRWLASAGSDKTARVWDVASRRCLYILQHEGGVWGVDFSPDGSTLVTGSEDGGIRFWDAANGELIKRSRFDDKIMATCFIDNGRVAAVGRNNFAYVLVPEG